MDQTKFSLNAGELSDEMAGRMDLQKIQMGLETGENVRVLRVGGVTRRSGFKLVAPVFDNARKSRLKGFRFSAEQGYMLEFSHFKMRIIRNGKLMRNNGIITPAPLVVQNAALPLSIPLEVQPAAEKISNKPTWTTGGAVWSTVTNGMQVHWDGFRWRIRVKVGGVLQVGYFTTDELDLISPADALKWSGRSGYTASPLVVVKPGNDPVLEYTTPWSEAQVDTLQFAQRIDRIIVSHGEVELYTILRKSDDSWVLEAFPWQERVWELYDSLNPITLSSTVTAVGAAGYMNASAALFSPEWVGTRLRLAHVRPEAPIRSTPQAELGGAVPFSASTGVYAIGQLVYGVSDGQRATGKYAGLTPVGNREFWRTTAPYNGPAGDFVTGKTDPDQYPTFFAQGGIVVPAQEVRGGWNFETFDTWRGTYVIERSYNNGVTWNPVKTCQSRDDKNFLVQDSEAADSTAQFRVLVLDFNNNQTGVRFAFTALSATIFGVFRLDSYVSPTQMYGTVERELESGFATSEWYEDAFNPKNGYPKSCTFHQKRLFLGGSKSRPQTIWASRTRKPFDFTQGTLADDGMSFETDATEYESVLWLVSHLSLLVGTTSGIWAISSPNGMSITPENNANNRQVRHGAFEGIPGVPLQNNVLFLQSKGRKIQELTGGSVEYGGYSNVDVTQLASHITKGGVVQIESGDTPDSTLYVTCGGQIGVLTYERAQNVVGWTRYTTQGYVESAAACPGRVEDDDLYIIVERGGNRFIEWQTPDMLRVEEASDMPNLAFLDSYVRKVDPDGFNVVEGLGHLETREVFVYADGESLGSLIVGGGQVVIPNGRMVNNAIVGLPYTSLVTTMPLDSGSIGVKASVGEAIIRFRNSLGMETSGNPTDPASWSIVALDPERTTDNEPFKLKSGDAQSTIHSTWKRKPTISVRQTQPYPMTILAIRYKAKTSP